MRYPQLFEGKYIIDWLGEMGLYANGMNGPQPLDFKEIRAWSVMMQTEPTPEEVKLMRSLSSEFCNMYYSSELSTPEPYQAEFTQEEIDHYTEVQKAKF